MRIYNPLSLLLFSLFSVWFSTVCYAAEKMDLEAELLAWVSEGKDLSRISQCEVTSESNGAHIFYYVQQSCISNQLPAYILLAECPNFRTDKMITILDRQSGRASKTFPIDLNTCAIFEKYMSEPESQPKGLGKEMVKEYAIQFFSGKTKPKVNAIPCVDIPLFILKKEQTYYMLSQTFPTREHAKKLLTSMQEHCDNKIDAWIRPVYLQ